MKRYIVKTVTGRRFIVAAKNALRARTSIRKPQTSKCPWSGNLLDSWEGEEVVQVAFLGTPLLSAS